MTLTQQIKEAKAEIKAWEKHIAKGYREPIDLFGLRRAKKILAGLQAEKCRRESVACVRELWG